MNELDLSLNQTQKSDLVIKDYLRDPILFWKLYLKDEATIEVIDPKIFFSFEFAYKLLVLVKMEQYKLGPFDAENDENILITKRINNILNRLILWESLSIDNFEEFPSYIPSLIIRNEDGVLIYLESITIKRLIEHPSILDFLLSNSFQIAEQVIENVLINPFDPADEVIFGKSNQLKKILDYLYSFKNNENGTIYSNVYDLILADEKAKNDRKTLTKYLYSDGLLIKYINPEIKRDRQLIRLALRSNRNAFFALHPEDQLRYVYPVSLLIDHDGTIIILDYLSKRIGIFTDALRREMHVIRLFLSLFTDELFYSTPLTHNEVKEVFGFNLDFNNLDKQYLITIDNELNIYPKYISDNFKSLMTTFYSKELLNKLDFVATFHGLDLSPHFHGGV